MLPKDPDTWEARMAARAKVTLEAEKAEREAKPLKRTPKPMVADCCTEWLWSDNYGWMQHQVCGSFQGACDHKHHHGERWLALAGPDQITESFELPDGTAVVPVVPEFDGQRFVTYALEEDN